MKDRLGRQINYLRVSITDRCNFRCRYCMPQGVELVPHGEVLRYEEILRIARLAAELGITRYKITGGEPLVRRGCTAFMAELKRLPGVEQVTLTTNGSLLDGCLEDLAAAGVDGINISLDTLEDEAYCQLTGAAPGTVGRVLSAARRAVEAGIAVKCNAVLLPQTLPGAAALVEAAEDLGADMRFIELMPIGQGAGKPWIPVSAVLELLRERWPDLTPTDERPGNGPARYYRSAALRVRVGVISAMSHAFCSGCNRVRLTSTGELKPCLCYGGGTDLRRMLRNGSSDEEIRQAMARCILEKPEAHCFQTAGGPTEGRGMNEIGG